MDPSAGKSGEVELVWAGERLVLMPERAIWWERGATLFLADPHFGKAATFRAAGIAVPEHSHTDDLARLDALLRRKTPERLVILGDFIHAKSGRTAAAFAALEEWRHRHRALPIVLVNGNHDRRAGPPPKSWNIEVVNGPWELAPFHCRHEPCQMPDQFTLAGHVHPAVHLRERIGSSISGPCFHFAANVAVLPAFANFTGMHALEAKHGDRVFLSGSEAVIEVTTAMPLSARVLQETN